MPPTLEMTCAVQSARLLESLPLSPGEQREYAEAAGFVEHASAPGSPYVRPLTRTRFLVLKTDPYAETGLRLHEIEVSGYTADELHRHSVRHYGSLQALRASAEGEQDMAGKLACAIAANLL